MFSNSGHKQNSTKRKKTYKPSFSQSSAIHFILDSKSVTIHENVKYNICVQFLFYELVENYFELSILPNLK